MLASFSVDQRCAVLLATVGSPSMVVLTSVSSPGAGQLMTLIVGPCSSSFCTTLHISAPEELFRCSYIHTLLHVSASLSANLCSLESKIAAAVVRPDTLIHPQKAKLVSVNGPHAPILLQLLLK